MVTYEVENPDGMGQGVRVTCTDHGESQEFEPGFQTVAFYCSECDVEVEISLVDVDDWRAWDERC